MVDELVGYTVVTVFILANIFLVRWSMNRSEQRRKLSGHRPDMRVLSRDPYSVQDAYNRRMQRQA